MEDMGMIRPLDDYRGRAVLVTGHTGFKGAWLCRILQLLGAKVVGYALPPIPGAAYRQMADGDGIRSFLCDIRDPIALEKAFEEGEPEIVFHLAAQPIVLEAYREPGSTFASNVQGTVNLLECVRQSSRVRSVVIVTTDKVYRNNEWCYGYRESDPLGDGEPYAASKACAEIVSRSYVETYFQGNGIALSTVRAGNVIGGGDVSEHRIVPDCIRAAKKGEPIKVRNPYSVRPYQHVLEPLFAYLMIAARQMESPGLSGAYNIGPNEDGCVSTAELADMFCKAWGDGQTWVASPSSDAPHESAILRLDCAKARTTFGWQSKWDIRTAVAKTIEWEQSNDKKQITDQQIDAYREVFQG